MTKRHLVCVESLNQYTRPRDSSKRAAGGHVMVGEEGPEERHLRRVVKRVEGVTALMRTTAYIVVMSRCAEAPIPPDPLDETLSKRAWERSMMRWRAALREALRRIHDEDVTQTLVKVERSG